MKGNFVLYGACICAAAVSPVVKAHTITFTSAPTLYESSSYNGTLNGFGGSAISDRTVQATIDWETHKFSKRGGTLYDESQGILTVEDTVYAVWTPNPDDPTDVPIDGAYTVEYVMREKANISMEIFGLASTPPWNPSFTGSGSYEFTSGFTSPIYLSVSSSSAATCSNGYQTTTGTWDNCLAVYEAIVFTEQPDGTWVMAIPINDLSISVTENFNNTSVGSLLGIDCSTQVTKQYSVVQVADATFTPYG